MATSSVANMIGTLAGYPLDTVRVRMQLENKGHSMLRVAGETMRGEGISGFLKGLSSLILGQTPYRMIIFTMTEATKKELSQSHPLMSNEKKAFIAGSVAGAAALVVNCPIELLKVRAQTSRNKTIKLTQEIPRIVSKDGPIGLFRGFGVMTARDVPSWGIYFFTYDFLKKKMGVSQSMKHD